MHLLTLIDFTETARIAVKQSVALAKLKNGSVQLTHITPQGFSEADRALLEEGFEDWRKLVSDSGVPCEVVLGNGEFFSEVANLVGRKKPNLVVVGNHGKKGLIQNLFGSNIMKLVQKLPVASLVVSDHTNTVEGGFRKALVPIAPHHDFMKKIKLTAKLLNPESGKLVLFTVMKPGVALDEKLQNNLDQATEYLNENGVNWEYLELDASHFSIGYSKEILDIANKDNYDLISIMAQVSKENRSFGTMDKENIILNTAGIPVLCVNS